MFGIRFLELRNLQREKIKVILILMMFEFPQLIKLLLNYKRNHLLLIPPKMMTIQMLIIILIMYDNYKQYHNSVLPFSSLYIHNCVLKINLQYTNNLLQYTNCQS